MFKFRKQVSSFPQTASGGLGGGITDEMRSFGVTRVLKLNLNEGPWPPFPDAIEAINAEQMSLNRYPDQSYVRLRAALSEKYSVSPDRIVCGPGSGSLLRTLSFIAIDEGDEVVMPLPTFPGLASGVRLLGGSIREVPVRNHVIDLPSMLDTINERTKIVYACNPNNPTGTTVSVAELSNYFRNVPDHVVTIVDEAYMEFAQGEGVPNGLDYLELGKPVIVLRTFSKVYGLAGLRVGYGFTSPEVADAMRRLQEPSSMHNLAQVAAIASLRRQDLVRQRASANAEALAYLHGELDKLGLEHTPSRCNFVFFDTKQDCREVARKLEQRGVVVGLGTRFQMPTYLRVTIGTPEDNEIFINALTAVLRS